MLLWRKHRLYTTNCKEVELKMNLHSSMILFQKDFNYKCQFCTKLRAWSRLISQGRAKYKDEVPDVLGSNQNIETSYKNKLKLKMKDKHFKDLHFRKRWMYVTAILKLWNFSGRDIISDFEILLSILNTFIIGTEEYEPKCYKVNDEKALQILYHDCSIILLLEDANHKYWLI